MKRIPFILPLVVFTLFLGSCKEPEPPVKVADLRFQFKFDPFQERLDNFGQPATMPEENAAQTPSFEEMSVHYIELLPNELTQYGQGPVVYEGTEQEYNGDMAIVVDEALAAPEGATFLTVSTEDIPVGTYNYMRVSVSYQKYTVLFDLINPFGQDAHDEEGILASFLGFNNYITDVTPRNITQQVNDSKLQGFWVFETDFNPPLSVLNNVVSGQAPPGATTVVNPIFNTSEIPLGSCIVTGVIEPPLEIVAGMEEDQVVRLSFSIQNSFEWRDTNEDGKWTVHVTPDQSEMVVDMGLRGLKVKLD